MQGKAYLANLLSAIVFPVLWVRSWRFAQEHSAKDPRAPTKVLVAIAASIIIGAGGAMMLVSMEASAHDGFYEELEGRVATATGETAYQDALSARDAARAQVSLADTKAADARAAGDGEAERNWMNVSAEARANVDDAIALIQELESNHALFLRAQQAIEARDDDAAKQILFTTSVDYDKLQDRSRWAFNLKDDAVSDLDGFLWWMLYPSLVGAFFAPLAFALGSILHQGWEPSDSVGFKPYPSQSAGWFLLLGAFGVPSLFFAAWVFADIEGRALEGQIHL